jgi:hypothetical protein
MLVGTNERFIAIPPPPYWRKQIDYDTVCMLDLRYPSMYGRRKVWQIQKHRYERFVIN